MVELRKRPARADPPSAPPAKRSSSKSNAKAPAGGASKVKQLANKAKEAVTGTPITASTPAADEAKPTSDLPVASETGVIPETTGTAGEGIESAPATTSTGGGGADASSKLSHDSVGKKINLTNDFGGKISTHEGKSVTLADLLKQGAASKGVVIFTYPKASTPGCTTQACLFRDNYKPLQEAGYAAYGLSSDSEKANGGFVAKQGLPFPLLVSTQ